MSIKAALQKARRYEQALGVLVEEASINTNDIVSLILINNAIINLLTALKKNGISELNGVIEELNEEFSDDIASFMYYLHRHLLLDQELNSLTSLRSYNRDYERLRRDIRGLMSIVLLLWWVGLAIALVFLNFHMTLIIIATIIGALVLINLFSSCADGPSNIRENISLFVVAVAPFITAVSAGLITAALLPALGYLLIPAVLGGIAMMYVNYLETYSNRMKFICDLHDKVIAKSNTLFENIMEIDASTDSEHPISNVDKLSIYRSRNQTLFSKLYSVCNDEDDSFDDQTIRGNATAVVYI